MERFDTPKKEISGHWVQAGAVDFTEMVDLMDEFFAAADDAAESVSVSTEEFRGAVHDQIRTEGQWVLVDGRGEGVIHDDERARAMRSAGQAGDVHYFDRGIGRSFQIEDFVATGEFGFDTGMVGGVRERDADLKTRQKFNKELVSAAVGVFDRDNAIPRGKQREERVAYGRHTAGEAGRGFGVFKVADFVFEGGDGGIAIAAVDVTGFFAEGHLKPFLHRVVAVRDAQRDWDLRGAGPVFSLLTGPDGAGCEAGRDWSI